MNLIYLIISRHEHSCSETFRCGVNSKPRRLLLPKNLDTAKLWFPNDLNAVILKSEKLLTSGKHSRQSPIFPGVDVPENSPQGQIMQHSKKTHKKNPKSHTLDSFLSHFVFICWALLQDQHEKMFSCWKKKICQWKPFSLVACGSADDSKQTKQSITVVFNQGSATPRGSTEVLQGGHPT